MLKYVEGILTKFSIGQRVFVLFQLLFFITLVYLGPKILQSYKPENESLNEKINKLEETINLLEDENRKKSDIIRDERISCTNQIVDRENQFVQMLTDLENGVNNIKKSKISFKRRSTIPSRMIIVDTVQTESYPAPAPMIIEDEMDSEDYVLNKIKSYKSTINQKNQ